MFNLLYSELSSRTHPIWSHHALVHLHNAYVCRLTCCVNMLVGSVDPSYLCEMLQQHYECRYVDYVAVPSLSTNAYV